jgi:hypothetical protein
MVLTNAAMAIILILSQVVVSKQCGFTETVTGTFSSTKANHSFNPQSVT